MGTDINLSLISFVGETLAPFYLHEPGTDELKPFIEEFKSIDTKQVADEWPFVEKVEAQCALDEIQNGLLNVPIEDLMWEYRRLFVGPAPKPAPAWGSVYTDPDTVCFGVTEIKLSTWLSAHEIERMNSESDPDDHFGYMLRLMSFIALNKPDILDEFLQSHFFTWAFHFLELFIASTSNPLYHGVATLSLASLQGIKEVREISPVYPHYYR